MTLTADFFTPSRQSPIAMLLFLLKFLRITIRQAWPIVVSLVFSLRKVAFADWVIYVIFIAIGVLYVFFSVFSYLRFRYHLREGEIVITEGVITRTTVNLPFEKIQTIDFKQNVLQQLFGVVELAIDSAGSKKQEVSLTAIPIKRAEALREYVLEEKKSIIAEHQVEEETTQTTTSPSTVILNLSIGELLKVGITQNHIKSLGLILVFFFGIFEQFRRLTEETELADEELQNTVGSYVESTVTTWLWVFSIAFILVIPLAVSLVTTVFTYFNMQLSLGSDGVKLVSGLLNKKQRSTTLNKIQSVGWGSNPLQKLLGLFTMKIYPAAATTVKLKNLLTIPGSRKEQIDKVLETLHFKEKSGGMREHRISPAYYQRALLIIGLVPTVIIAPFIFYFFTWYGLLTLLWPVFIYVEALVEYQKWRFYTNEHILQTRYGLFGIHHKVIYWHKIQAIKITQTPYQKRNNLANIVCYQAGHQMRIPYISLDIAQQIEQYAMYKIETDEVGWM